jgi:hypothetical protein
MLQRHSESESVRVSAAMMVDAEAAAGPGSLERDTPTQQWSDSDVQTLFSCLSSAVHGPRVLHLLHSVAQLRVAMSREQGVWSRGVAWSFCPGYETDGFVAMSLTSGMATRLVVKSLDGDTLLSLLLAGAIRRRAPAAPHHSEACVLLGCNAEFSRGEFVTESGTFKLNLPVKGSESLLVCRFALLSSHSE